MRNRIYSVGLGIIVAAAGCDTAARAPRVAVPEQATMDSPTRMADKPLPPPTRDDLPPPPFDDVAIVSQEAPETPEFLKAYAAVGRPRICVFVNRTLQGEVVPVNPNDPLVSVEHTKTSTTGVTVDRTNTQSRDGYYQHDQNTQTDRFQSTGPGQYKETSAVYLKPGQYDEVAAKSLDYEAIENILTDFLGGDGQVTIMSPTLVRQKLTAEQIKDLESGQPQVASQIVQQLGADILVQVQAHPTQQSRDGLQVRLVCEAMNIKGGQSLGRAVVDIKPPLEKTQINKFTRFCARKLMHDMTLTWSAPPPAPASMLPASPMEKPIEKPIEKPTMPGNNPPATQPGMPER